jgi:hypothetical protein
MIIPSNVAIWVASFGSRTAAPTDVNGLANAPPIRPTADHHWYSSNRPALSFARSDLPEANHVPWRPYVVQIFRNRRRAHRGGGSHCQGLNERHPRVCRERPSEIDIITINRRSFANLSPRIRNLNQLITPAENSCEGGQVGGCCRTFSPIGLICCP